MCPPDKTGAHERRLRSKATRVVRGLAALGGQGEGFHPASSLSIGGAGPCQEGPDLGRQLGELGTHMKMRTGCRGLKIRFHV